jgi:hypothetical protein
MPETARTGKRICEYANLWGQRRRSRQRTELDGVIGITGCSGSATSDASHSDLTNGHKPEHYKGAGERRRKSFSGYPLTTGCGDRIPYLEAPTVVGDSRASSLSLADALCRRPGVIPATASRSNRIAILRFANLHLALPGGREIFDRLGAYSAPRRGYFFFLAATLRFAGAFFFAAVFAFVAFFTILPS